MRLGSRNALMEATGLQSAVQLKQTAVMHVHTATFAILYPSQIQTSHLLPALQTSTVLKVPVQVQFQRLTAQLVISVVPKQEQSTNALGVHSKT